MISVRKQRSLLDMATTCAVTLDPHYPYLSPAARTIRTAQQAEDEAAVARVLHRLTALVTVAGEFGHRQDLTTTVQTMLTLGHSSWALTPAVSPYNRKTARAELIENIDACYTAVRQVAHRGDHQMAWSLTEALTGLARIHHLGPQWPDVLRRGILAAYECAQPLAASAFHAALAHHHLHDHPPPPNHNKWITHHAERALQLAKVTGGAAARSTALDLLAQHQQSIPKPGNSRRSHAAAIVLDAEGGDIHALARHLLTRARLDVARRRFEHAAEDSLLASKLGEVLDDDRLTALALLVHTETLWHQGARITHGMPAAEAAMSLLTDLGDAHFAALATAWTSRWHARCGDPRSSGLAEQARQHRSPESRLRREVEEVLAQPLPPVTLVTRASPQPARRPICFGNPHGDLLALLTRADPGDLDALYVLLGSPPPASYDPESTSTPAPASPPRPPRLAPRARRRTP